MLRALRISFATCTVAGSLVACSLMFGAGDLRKLEAGTGDADDSDVGGQPADAFPESGDAGRWCDWAPRLGDASFFCDDFDDEGPFTRWTGVGVNGSSSIERSSLSSRSSPHALFASVKSGTAFVFRETQSTIRKVHVAFDIKVDTRDTQSGYAEVCYIQLPRSGSTVSSAFFLGIGNAGAPPTTWTAEAYLPDGGLPQHNVMVAGNPAFDDWTRVDFDVDLATNPHRMTVAIDGKMAGTDTLEDTLYVAGPVRVEVGIVYTDIPSSGWGIRYDNVTIEWE